MQRRNFFKKLFMGAAAVPVVAKAALDKADEPEVIEVEADAGPVEEISDNQYEALEDIWEGDLLFKDAEIDWDGDIIKSILVGVKRIRVDEYDSPEYVALNTVKKGELVTVVDLNRPPPIYTVGLASSPTTMTISTTTDVDIGTNTLWIAK